MRAGARIVLIGTPLSITLSVPGTTCAMGSLTRVPFNVTLPLAIALSAPRLESKPELAMAREIGMVVLMIYGTSQRPQSDG